MDNQRDNFSRQLWRRLKKNGGAVFGMVVIGLSILVSLLGYLIAPDPTPDANRQTVEIQAKHIGYTQRFLKIPENHIIGPGFFSRLFSGRPDSYRYLPITGFSLTRDSIIVNKYVDEDTTVRQSFVLSKIDKDTVSLLKNNIVNQTYWFGTDKFGRDILSRLIIGTRVSLAVGLIAVLISLSLGILLGALAGYYRGRTDRVIMWLINVTWSIPTLLLVFAITMAMGKGFWQIFIAVGLTMWVSVARLVRGQVMAVKEQEYIQAARALGFTDARIIVRHILPNILGQIGRAHV